jgi:hypothetical protein
MKSPGSRVARPIDGHDQQLVLARREAHDLALANSSRRAIGVDNGFSLGIRPHLRPRHARGLPGHARWSPPTTARQWQRLSGPASEECLAGLEMGNVPLVFEVKRVRIVLFDAIERRPH